jgi:hypothetical protein
MEEDAREIVNIYNYTHIYSFNMYSLLNFLLPACRPDFVELPAPHVSWSAAALRHAVILNYVQTRQESTYKRNPEALSRNRCYHGKAVNIIYSECVSVASFIQHAKRMRPILLSVTCLYHTFPHYLTNRTIMRKNITELKMWVLIFYTNFV